GWGYNAPNQNQPYLAHGHLPCATTPSRTKLASPANDAQVAKAKPTLKWQAVSGALYYNLVVSIDRSVTTSALVKTTVFAPSFKLAQPLVSGKTYTWRVQACNNVGCGAWSRTSSFRVK